MSDAAPSTISGVRYSAIVRHADSRGSFRELWRAKDDQRTSAAASMLGATAAPPDGDPNTGPFVQANLSISAPGVLRGLHFHRRQLDRWIVADGRALVALVDIRPMLDDRGPLVVETRELGPDEVVEIPTGVAHGFLALERLELIYFVTNEYDNSDELGFAWDDPAVGVPWPRLSVTADGQPILSDRDRSNPPLADVIAAIDLG